MSAERFARFFAPEMPRGPGQPGDMQRIEQSLHTWRRPARSGVCVDQLVDAMPKELVEKIPRGTIADGEGCRWRVRRNQRM